MYLIFCKRSILGGWVKEWSTKRDHESGWRGGGWANVVKGMERDES